MTRPLYDLYAPKLPVRCSAPEAIDFGAGRELRLPCNAPFARFDSNGEPRCTVHGSSEAGR